MDWRGHRATLLDKMHRVVSRAFRFPVDLPRPVRTEFVRFCAVGASGYCVNLAVYTTLLALGMRYLAAAAVSFLIAAVNNYAWNRVWTFRTTQSALLAQGVRAIVVSALALGANEAALALLVAAGSTDVAGEAAAIVLVTPFSFAANKLWAFASPTPPSAVMARHAGTRHGTNHRAARSRAL